MTANSACNLSTVSEILIVFCLFVCLFDSPARAKIEVFIS